MAAGLPEAGDATMFTRRLAAVTLATLVAAFGLAVWSTIAARGLHADGAHVLLRILAFEDFYLNVPARRTIQVLMQLPTVLTVRAGLVDLDGAIRVYCASLALLPLVLLGACYALLPRDRKHFFFWPLLQYLALTLGTSASAVSEGPSATAYFWMLLYLVLFRPARWQWLLAMATLAIPTIYVQETYALLAPVLALAAAWRARVESGRLGRGGFAALAIWFLAVAAIQAGNIIRPRSPTNRDSLIAQFGDFSWLHAASGGMNLPAILGLAAFVVLAASALLGRSPDRGATSTARWVVGAFALAAAIGLVHAATHIESIAPWQQFSARHNPAILSVPMAMLALATATLGWPSRWWALPSAPRICAVLAVAGFGWHAIAIVHWTAFLGTFRAALERGGLVQLAEVEATLAPRELTIFRNNSWSWSAPMMSIVLAPGGAVSTIIDNPRARYRPWNPARAEQLPRSRFWTFDAYVAKLAAPHGGQSRP